MAIQHPGEGSGRSEASAENSESTVELNIKTLDSRIYSFHVDKNMLVSSFKEKIANEIGVPVGHQRLIFRGKVLKDDVLLSEYYIENGHTLHLVERQPVLSQPSPNSESGATNGDNSNQENDPSVGGPRHRVGQISHSVVLGTFNVGDQPEGGGGMADINRVIGSVLNSFGIGNQSTTGVGGQQPTAQGSQGNATEGNQGQGGPSVPPQSPLPGFAFPTPSVQVPSPFSLHTLSEFVNRMRLAFPHSGHQSNTASSNEGVLPTVELPSNAQGLPTVDALIIVLGRVQRLLNDQAVAELSHLAGRLENTRIETDPSVRGQIQNESLRLGMTMQCLGSLFLELGRTLSTLRMGQSHADSIVNSGPAVFISELGPNPIMVQPFPLQTNSVFGGAAPPFNTGAFGPAGIPRHINVHIHSGVNVRPNGQRVQGGEQVNSSAGSDSSNPPGVIPSTNIIATATPTGFAVSNSEQSNVLTSQAPLDSDINYASSFVNQQNSQARGFGDSVRGDNQASSGMPESSVAQDQSLPVCEREEAKNQKSSDAESMGFKEETVNPNQYIDDNKSEGVPLGLGLNGLQPKRRNKAAKSQSKSGDETSSNPAPNLTHQAMRSGQQILQSLVNSSSGANGNVEESSLGSNILSQLTQNPIIRDTTTQVFQQIGTQGGIQNMVSGLGMGPGGGGVDLSGLLQQLMPIVSQALGNVSEQPNEGTVGNPQSYDDDPELSGNGALDDQANLQQVIEKIEDSESPTDIFQSMVETALSSNNGQPSDELMNELRSDESLANEYMEMLRSDARKHFNNSNASADKP